MGVRAVRSRSQRSRSRGQEDAEPGPVCQQQPRGCSWGWDTPGSAGASAQLTARPGAEGTGALGSPLKALARGLWGVTGLFLLLQCT